MLDPVNLERAIQLTIGVVLVYKFVVRQPLEMWLKRSFLEVGRVAVLKQRSFNFGNKLGLMSPITVPQIAVEKLTEASLPKGLLVRPWSPPDADACLELLRINAPGRFPDDTEDHFIPVLNSGGDSLLVVEQGGQVIACGGIIQRERWIVLVYGLVHPEHQGKGIGRLLLASRLARLSITSPVVVSICAVEASIGYYERFGFQRYALWPSADGSYHPQAGVVVTPSCLQWVLNFLTSEGYPPLAPLSLVVE